MIPLKDENPTRRLPIITILVIAVNVWFFFEEIKLGAKAGSFIANYGLIPVRYTNADIAKHFTLIEQATPFFSSMFLHGGWLHIVGNMWILWIFGDNVEDKLGPARFIVLYLVSGLVAAMFQIFFTPHSEVPIIGASGAVAGVMGAYLRFYPKAKVVTMIPPFILGPFFLFPAFIFLGVWFILQLFSGTLTLGLESGVSGGIAWWAHVGGFAMGVILAGALQRRKPPRYTDVL
ncbi:MAG: rhomboid family intramembrane serine protease [Verrucomicrobia bacterium]|nr:rhomboid family intramembrane serine protease [Verrucomicrobiota bacterium]